MPQPRRAPQDHGHHNPAPNQPAGAQGNQPHSPLRTDAAAEHNHTEHNHIDHEEHGHHPSGDLPADTSRAAGENAGDNDAHDHDAHDHGTHGDEEGDDHSHAASQDGAVHSHDERNHDEHNRDEHEHGEHEHGDHEHHDGLIGWIRSLFGGHAHTHDHTELATDRAFLENEEGIRTVWLALAALGITTVLQFVIYASSGSIALLADTIHNLGDGLNSIPLLIAFYLARRTATRRYNYGFARAEDVAGIFIVFSIAFSAGWIFWESYQKLIDLEPIRKPLWVAAAAIVGFLGNEAVALLQIRKGRQLGSAALVADGLHARTDGLTSLAVLVAVFGHWINVPILDPLVGLAIGVAILFITKDASISMWHRLMDAIDPEILARAENAAASADDRVRELRRVRMRWVGHRLHAEATIAVDPQMTTEASHHVAEHLRRALFEALPKLSEAVVHVEPAGISTPDPHEHTRAFETPPQSLPD